jgi:hypothetical protein
VGQAGPFTAPEVAAVAWGFAALGHLDVALLGNLLQLIPEVTPAFTPHEVPMVVWGMAELCARAPSAFAPECAFVLKGLAAFTLQGAVIPGCSVDERISLAWSFIKARLPTDTLLAALLGGPPLGAVQPADLSPVAQAQMRDVRDYVYGNPDALPRTAAALSASSVG